MKFEEKFKHIAEPERASSIYYDSQYQPLELSLLRISEETTFINDTQIIWEMNVHKLPAPIKPVFSTNILPLELSDIFVDLDIRGDDFKFYLENKQVNLVG